LCLNRLRSSLQWEKEKNRINVLLKSLAYNEDFGGMGKVYAHTWTNEQILSIFRIKTSGYEVRDYVTKVLHQIQEEEVAAFNNKLSKRQIALNSLKRSIRQTLDGITWDDEHLSQLHRALYGEVKEAKSKTSTIPKRYRHRIKNLEQEAEVFEEVAVVGGDPQGEAK
jgi:nucleoside diphosphate kinase